ncbi:MAG: methyltransferase domain-containing protein [Burkholderiales bacterium]|nr:methyltransferase domain-containing protein [Burkholderiales bacterium]
MDERLDLLRIEPRMAVDLGSGRGAGAGSLRQRYPGCTVVELDLAHAMLRASRRAVPWWRRGSQRFAGRATPRVCGDMTRSSFAERVFDLVWSNLALPWVEPRLALAEMYRILRPGGVCMFSTLGPDTLKELRAAYASADAFVHVNRFVDLHDIGDLLLGEHFADPVMDMEYLTLTYPDVTSLLREIKAAGAHNANAGRNRALSGRAAFARMTAAYEGYRKEGRLPATFEIVYGHAWRPHTERASAAAHALIQFHPRRGPPA